MEARAHCQREYSYRGQKDLDRCLGRKAKFSMNGHASDMVARVLELGRLPHVCVVRYTFNSILSPLPRAHCES